MNRIAAIEEIAVHMIGKGWVRKSGTEAQLNRWLANHEGEYDNVMWSAN
jgi:hypothetical protein